MLGINLTVSSQNVNSLNASSELKTNQQQKLSAIVNLKSDIICLCDTRLSNKNNINCASSLASSFEFNPIEPYTFIFNSSKNKRGCAILLKKSCNFIVQARRDDPEENFLVLRVEYKGKIFIIGTVYGPNITNHEFFDNLTVQVKSLGDYPVILAGDWNCTYSSSPLAHNLDCLNMVNLPNLTHSLLLNNLCEALEVEDPYRAIYPNHKDYTYVPRAVGKKNRSRIDFFLVSSNALQQNFSCKISDSLLHGCFDHKCISLELSGSKRSFNPPNIFGTTIDLPESEICIWTSIFELYVIHADLELLAGGANMQQELLLRIGRAKKLFRDLGLPLHLRHQDDLSQELITDYNNILNEIEGIRDFFLDRDIFNTVTMVEPDTFMELLLITVRNEILNFQCFLKREGLKIKSETAKKLSDLKKDYEINFAKICQLESKLQIINEAEIRSKIENFSNFEILNREKMTPYFLNVFRGPKKVGSLEEVCSDEGVPFDTDEKRHEHIVQFFEKVYAIPDNYPVNFEGCVDNFLGDLVNHPLIRGCRLAGEESMSLDIPLDISELDKSVFEGKNNTAGGADGLNNKFLKKFWKFIRIPLLKYSNFCFENRSLSATFKNANIRLIPKKGDTKLLKNWRPISLLPCVYKVVSRAVYNRVKKFTDRFTSRAQKGFTKNRYIQEVLINVMQNISFCQNENINGAIVSIDFKKAFDTVYHGFIRDAYRFLGLGQEMLNIFDTLGTNRTACIILENGKVSKRFNLNTGRPQGEILSPVQFNVGEQILLFRIELDPAVSSVYQHMLVPRSHFVPDPDLLPVDFRFESGGETNKTDCFADDANVTTTLEPENIRALKNILDEFGNLSGLQCNYDKSFILPTNPNIPQNVKDEIESIGLPIKKKINVLGFELTDTGIDADLYADSLVEKIQKIIGFWHRYRLSLQGRINVFKTLLLAQINYGGCFLKISGEKLSILQEICNNFVLAGMRVAREKLYANVHSGGLGLINIRDFLLAQQSVWVGRIFRSTRDCWRLDFYNISSGNPLTVRSNDRRFDTNKALKPIAESFTVFRNCLYDKSETTDDFFIFSNDKIKRSADDNGLLDPEFFLRNVPALNLETVSKLKVKDFFQNNAFKSRAELAQDTNCDFNMVTYFRLRTALLFFKQNYRVPVLPMEQKIRYSLDALLSKDKKGSKHLRKIISEDKLPDYTVANFTTVKTYFRLAGSEIPNCGELRTMLSMWKKQYVSCYLSDFIFKLYNNCLGLNNRVAHFVADHNAACTFCVIGGTNPAPKESFDHLFFYCGFSESIIKFIGRRCFQGIINTDNALKQLVLTGNFVSGTRTIRNEFTIFCSISILHLIWLCKTTKTCRSCYAIEYDFIRNIKTGLSISAELRSKLHLLEMVTETSFDIFKRDDF
jgi:exonuclease III